MTPRTLIFFFCLCLNSILAAQNRDACRLLREAYDAKCRSQYDSSIFLLLEVTRRFPEHALSNEINYAIGRLQSRMGRYPEAKMRFLRFIHKTYPEFRFRTAADKDCDHPQRGNCGSLISTESYADLQHYACLDLHEIYLKENKPDSALFYLTLADKKFTMISDCANGMGMQAIQFAISYSDVHLARGDTTAAIRALLNRYYISEAGAEVLSQKLKATLRSKYSKEEIQAAFDAAIEQMKFEIKKGKHRPIVILKLTLFGTEVSIVDFYHVLDGKIFEIKNKEDAVHWIRNDYHYRQLLK